MGLAFGVGFGHFNLETIRQMLKDPTFQAHTHNPRLCRMALPKGLHLADVSYCPEYLGDITDNEGNLPIGPPPEYPSPNIQWDKMEACMKATQPRCGITKPIKPKNVKRRLAESQLKCGKE